MVLVLAAVVFGGMEAALYGAVGLFVTTRVMDTVLYGLDTSKVAYIISDEWKAVSDMLMGDLDRGVTLLQGEGGYTGTEKKVLLVAFKQKEIVDIKRRVHDIRSRRVYDRVRRPRSTGEGWKLPEGGHLKGDRILQKWNRT